MFLLISGGHIGAQKRCTNVSSVRGTFRKITQKLCATLQRPETWTNCLYISGALARARSGAPWVRKFGKLSIRDFKIKTVNTFI